MKLNRHNYEEYFILYMDNELGSEDRREVEVFAQENPDLKAELDILLQARLVPDTDITFSNKDILMARNSSSITMNNYEEWLLCYIDNELNEEETKDVERFVAANPAVQKELHLFRQAKLQPDAIVFPDKKSLYRKEEKAKVIAISWRRIAVAATLLIGISTTAVILLNKRSTEGGNGIAKGTTNTPGSNANTPSKQSSDDSKVNAPALATNNDPKKVEPANSNPVAVAKKDIINPEKKKEHVLPVKQDEPDNLAYTSHDKPTNNLTKPTENPNVIGGNDASLTKIKVKQVNTSVTPAPDDSYNNQKTTPDNPDVVLASNDGNKNKLRGFFRKVTRTFEKRANIPAADDDDRLLIAGLAIKTN